MAKKILLEIDLKNKNSVSAKVKKKKQTPKETEKEPDENKTESACYFRRIMIFVVIAACVFCIIRNSSLSNSISQSFFNFDAARKKDPEDSSFRSGNVFTPGPDGKNYYSETLPSSESYYLNNISNNKDKENILNGKKYNRENTAQDILPEKLKIIRLVSWNLYPLDFAKITDPENMARIAELFSKFDLIAVQGIKAKNLSVSNTILYLLEKNGLRYDCVIAAPSPEAESQTAFFYNRNSIGVDRETIRNYSSGGRWCSEILCASFRTAQAPPEKAFTFTLINIDLTGTSKYSDRDCLFDLYRNIRDTGGRNGIAEDDVILIGSFNVPASRLGALGQAANLAAVHFDKPTTINGEPFDNILFDSRAVTEYMERFGIVDLEHYFKISPEEARTLSEHRPIWADFSIYENSQCPFCSKGSIKNF